MKKLAFCFIASLFWFLSGSSVKAAPTISNVRLGTTTVPVYEKFEAKFDVATVSEYPFIQYDETVIPGVPSKMGVTVDALITFPSGKTIRHPAFYMTETRKEGTVYVETNTKYWAIRFSPLEVGVHKIIFSAQDASGTTTTSTSSPYTFQAVAPTKKGFVQVSKADPRYFEYSNGDLFFPTGPANMRNGNYNLYKDTGANITRFWLGGIGIYSTNWARWKSSGELHGNEGHMASLTWLEKYPGHELSYKIIYNTDTSKGPNGFRTWITSWLDESNGGRVVAGKRYQVKLVFKAVNISGPRNPSASSTYGFVIKAADPQWGADDKSADQWDAALRNFPSMAPTNGSAFTSSADSRCTSTSSGWCTYTTFFTAPKNQDSFYLYLDNVTAGQVYVDEFSVKEVDSSGNIIGGEVIRNARADQHYYFEQRPAAALDDQISNAENNGVTLKLVVHDKNDWIQNHLRTDGSWADSGNGYYQPENTKARWLLRSWYRYATSRWGYSPAIHSFELNNEGPPNEDPAGSGSAPHWRTAQEFSKYIHQVYPARRILSTTSFWCCWRPKFWGNSSSFPDIDYADFHMYTSNIESGLIPLSHQYDFAAWTLDTSLGIYKDGYPAGQKGVGKPAMLAETGVDTGDANSLLSQQNPGLWFHEMIWAQLNFGAMSTPMYWFDEHLLKMDSPVEKQTKPFYLFVKDLDLNKGGYADIAASSTNEKLRLIGQKNTSKNKAHLWIQNTDSTWKKYRDGVRSSQAGNITFTLSPNKTYTVDWWDTYAGSIRKTETISSNGSGVLTLSVSNLSQDIAAKVYIPGSQATSQPTPQMSSMEACNADIDQQGTEIAPGYYDGSINLSDYAIFMQDFLRSSLSNVRSNIDKDEKNLVNLLDYAIFGRWFLKSVTCQR